MTQSLPGWVSVTPTVYRRPVQVESATGGITAASMPDGRVLLVWPNGGRARCAVVANVAAALTDNTVTAPQIATIVTLAGLRRTAAYTISGQLYVTVNTWTGSFTTTTIYKANDPLNPDTAGWTLQATLQADNTPGAHFGTQDWGAGVPIRLSTGRWVMGQGGWEVGFPPGAAASGSFIHAYYSDGGAAGPWVRTLLYGAHVSGFPRMTWEGAQVAVDPATGYIYLGANAQVPNQVMLFQSINNGLTWTRFDASNGFFAPGAYSFSFALDNGTDLYAIDSHPFVGGQHGFYVNDGALGGAITNTNTNNGGWSYSGTMWTAPGMSNDVNSRKVLIVGQRVLTFAQDQIADAGGTTVPGWIIGNVQAGTVVSSGWQ